MTKVEDEANKIKELVNLAKEVSDKLITVSGAKAWNIKHVADSYVSMFDRFCPFKIGDRVMLALTPHITPESGWYHARHFLIEGALGTVTERDYHDGKFEFYVTFDNETWIDGNGNERTLNEKHWFLFDEYLLTAVKGAND